MKILEKLIFDLFHAFLAFISRILSILLIFQAKIILFLSEMFQYYFFPKQVTFLDI